MVIVLTGPSGSGPTTAGTTLAERLGWPVVDAAAHGAPASPAATTAAATASTASDIDRSLDHLRSLIVRALDRRESMILACPALPHAHLQHLIDGLRPVRIVYLRTDRDSREEPADAALVLDAAVDVETLVGEIRHSFGV